MRRAQQGPECLRTCIMRPGGLVGPWQYQYTVLGGYYTGYYPPVPTRYTPPRTHLAPAPVLDPVMVPATGSTVTRDMRI